MNKYKAQWAYSATLDHVSVSFGTEDQVWMDEETAERINRDSPGVLVLEQVGGQPHVHRMMTHDRPAVGLRNVETITESVDDEPARPTPPATPAATLLAEKKGVNLADVSFAGERITVQDVRTHLGDDKQESVQPKVGFGATKSGDVL
jgi:pyruvate/2-oxoglutarate dehydrogenase complex dihydrolipoamide acyltransferase (E2) component